LRLRSRPKANFFRLFKASAWARANGVARKLKR
jgi:hypothetical protein